MNYLLRWGKSATSEAGNISSELLICGGGVYSILLLCFMAKCLETILEINMYMTHVYFYVFYSECVGVCENVCCVVAVVEDVYLCKG